MTQETHLCAGVLCPRGGGWTSLIHFPLPLSLLCRAHDRPDLCGEGPGAVSEGVHPHGGSQALQD